MYSDIVLYLLSVNHQKDLQREAEKAHLARHLKAGHRDVVKVTDLRGKVIQGIKIWKNGNAKQRSSVIN